MKKTQKALSLALALCILLSSVSMAVFGAGVSDAFAGEGTEEKPYLIGTAEELFALASALNSNTESEYRTAHFKLTDDIDLAFSSFEPIGKNSVYAFRGVFDGDGHEIKSLNVSDASGMYIGLFGCITDATVRNLRVSGEIFSSESGAMVGGIAGAATGNSRFENCVNYCSVSAVWKSSAGGICGYYRNGGEITDNAVIFSSCVNAGDVFISGEDSDRFSTGLAGGILGCSENCAQFENCLNIGSVRGANLAAGICGSAGSRQSDNCSPFIKACVNAGKITSAVGAYPIYAKEDLSEDAVLSCFADSGENKFVTVSENLLSPDVISALGSAWISGSDLPYPASVGAVLSKTAYLSSEAEKYVSTVFVGDDKNVGDEVSLLAEGAVSSDGVRAYTLTDSKYISPLPSASFCISEKNDGTAAKTENLTLVLERGGARVRKTVKVIFSAKAGAREELMDKLAEVYASQSVVDEWAVFDMSAYGRLSGKTSKISDDALQNYINTAISDITSDSAFASDLAKAEVILSSIGADTTRLYPVNSKKPFSNPAKLRAADFGSYYSTAIWVLFADEWGNINLSSPQIESLIGVIKASLGENGLLTSKYGEYSFDDPDSTGWAVGAMARFVSDTRDKYGVREIAAELSERMVNGLSAAQGDDGSYGNANTDAMVITGLLAAGISPETDARFIKNGSSLADALMLYADESKAGFTSPYGDTYAVRATEQGFRALVALRAFEENESRAYNIYAPNGEVSSGGRKPVFATGSGEITTPSVPDTDEKITSSLSVIYGKKVWIPEVSLSLKKGSFVYNLIKDAFAECGAVADGLSKGYIKAITYKGETHTQFDEGKNSGWLYYVNGELPNVGINDYKLSDGDKVELVYTKDYTTAPGAVGSVGASDEKKEETKEEETKAVYTDVSEKDWFSSAVKFVSENKIMNGVSENAFAPNEKMTRAMVWTVLARISGEDTSNGAVWYEKGRAWAMENSVSDGELPNGNITREQLAAMLYRFAESKEYDISQTADISEFDDEKSVSPYALGAMKWAYAQKIITGKGEKTLDPRGFASRAEVAAMLMRFVKSLELKMQDAA